MPSNMGWCNRFCQLIEMLFMKLQICLIKTAILMWCTWMSVKYLACQYTTVWLRNKNHAKLTWYIISGVKTAFHNMIVSGFIIFIRPAQASASCCLSVFLCQWLGWEHTLLIGHADVAGEVRNEQITETTQSRLLGTLVREGAGILMWPNVMPQPWNKGRNPEEQGGETPLKAAMLQSKLEPWQLMGFLWDPYVNPTVTLVYLRSRLSRMSDCLHLLCWCRGGSTSCSEGPEQQERPLCAAGALVGKLPCWESFDAPSFVWGKERGV